jgi:hypothetical protein
MAETKAVVDLGALAKNATLRLLDYCRAHNWAGYDPYDALNSRVFRALPFLDFRLARLVLTQGVKRCPVNLRPFLLVPRLPNPKGIALFLSALIKLKRSEVFEVDAVIPPMAEKLLSLRSPKQPRACWGYSFDWQTRTRLIPKGSPNIICSTFAANALLDAHELYPDPCWLEAAIGTADFILENLFWRGERSKACFSYTLAGRTEVHNANLLGAAFLCRIGRISDNMKYTEPALDAVRFSVEKQHPDGAWNYGEAPAQRWIDNFHTGFNLVALRRIQEYAKTNTFDQAISKGYSFFLSHFFRQDGAPRYFHNATYPIDIHSAAQSIITLTVLRELRSESGDLTAKVLAWTIRNMSDDRGYFYFQKHARYTMRISFMRWSQAWMLLALATYIESYAGVHGGEA